MRETVTRRPRASQVVGDHVAQVVGVDRDRPDPGPVEGVDDVSSRGRPPTGSRGLGRWSVTGASRVP